MGLGNPYIRRMLTLSEQDELSLMRSRLAFIEEHKPSTPVELPLGWTSSDAHERVNRLAGELGMDKSSVLKEIMLQASELSACKAGGAISDAELFEIAFEKVSSDLKHSFSA